ncbi:MAG: 4-hydroxy-tetrahydrodipicolinate synthase [Syntrophothermus sp.]
MARFGRVLTAMVTPFDDNLQVDYVQAARLAERLVATGSDGIVVAGTTGESPTLSKEEKLKLFAAVAEAVGGKCSVIAGTGSYNTEESIELTKAASKTGVDGILLVSPYYNKPSQEGLYQHFKAIAAATELPVMLYNIPGRTAVNILPETLARLAEIQNIVAVKEASGDIGQIAEERRRLPADFDIYSGDDAFTLPILSVGGCGIVSVASHLVGKQIHEMIDLFFQGKVKEATTIHLQLLPLFKVLFITTNPVPVKVALGLTGFKTGGFRLPLYPPAPKELEAIKAEMRNAGLLS